jgi:hypothetical protein
MNKICDLSPLQGMPLIVLNCENNSLQDLTPLRGMPLTELNCSHNPLYDLTCLSELPLQRLICVRNRITDLTPVRNMPLVTLDCRQNHLTDLAPIAGLPLQHLSCGGNPLTSLRPLRGLPLRDLAMEGIPLTTENQEILLELPLCHLSGDLSEPMLTMLRTHSTLQGINHHTVAYVKALGTTLLQALSAWQQADTAPDRCPALYDYATACGTSHYLALPFRLSRPDAESFCRYYGGILACPATVEQHQALCAYLTQIIYYNNEFAEVSYHLGLAPDLVSGAFHWLSNEPYHWHRWLRPDGERSTPAGLPLFVVPMSLDATYWWRDPNPHACHYSVIEWIE